MICEKCNKQFKSKIPISESHKMIGLCESCGIRLKFDYIPEGFTCGAIILLLGAPFFLISIFSWLFIVLTVTVIGLACLGVWFLTRMLGGYVVTESVEEYDKGNIGLAFMSGLVGFIFTLVWCILAMKVLV